MEKIKERDFKYYWGPQAVVAAVGLVSLLLGWIPVLGMLVSVVMMVVAAGCALFLVIYPNYFYYQLSLDINAVCEGDGLETKSYMYVIALNAVTFGLYGKYWIYKAGQRLKLNAPRYGFKMLVGGKELLVLDLFSAGMISTWEFVRNMNQIAKVYNQTGVTDMIAGGVQ